MDWSDQLNISLRDDITSEMTVRSCQQWIEFEMTMRLSFVSFGTPTVNPISSLAKH